MIDHILSHSKEVFIVHGSKNKRPLLKNKEVLTIERLIPSKNRSGGPHTAQIMELLTMPEVPTCRGFTVSPFL